MILRKGAKLDGFAGKKAYHDRHSISSYNYAEIDAYA
jgi:hypothetical protein